MRPQQLPFCGVLRISCSNSRLASPSMDCTRLEPEKGAGGWRDVSRPLIASSSSTFSPFSFQHPSLGGVAGRQQSLLCFLHLQCMNRTTANRMSDAENTPTPIQRRDCHMSRTYLGNINDVWRRMGPLKKKPKKKKFKGNAKPRLCSRS